MILVWAILSITLCACQCAGEVSPGLPTRMLGFQPRGSAYAEAVSVAARRTAEVVNVEPVQGALADHYEPTTAARFCRVSLQCDPGGGRSRLIVYCLPMFQIERRSLSATPLKEKIATSDSSFYSPARWIRAMFSMAEVAFIVNRLNRLVLSPGTGNSELRAQYDGGLSLKGLQLCL